MRERDVILVDEKGGICRVGPRQPEQAARSAEPAANSPAPPQQPHVLPPGSMAAHSMVQQLAASVPLPQQQAMVGHEIIIRT